MSCSWNIKLANRSPVVMVVVSNANLGNDPMRPKTVERTASCTRGWAVDVNLDIRSEGDSLDTTCRYGLVDIS